MSTPKIICAIEHYRLVEESGLHTIEHLSSDAMGEKQWEIVNRYNTARELTYSTCDQDFYRIIEVLTLMLKVLHGDYEDQVS